MAWDDFRQKENTKGDGQAAIASWKQAHKHTHGSTKNQRKVVHDCIYMPEGCIQHPSTNKDIPLCKAPLSSSRCGITLHYGFQKSMLFPSIKCSRGYILCPDTVPVYQHCDTGNLLTTACLQPLLWEQYSQDWKSIYRNKMWRKAKHAGFFQPL